VLTWVLQQFGDYHFIFDAVSGVAVVAGSYFGLVIKNLLSTLRSEIKDVRLEQAQTKAELLEHQNAVKDEVADRHAELLEGQHDLRAEFREKHAENKEQLAVHVQDDKGQFAELKTVLGRIDQTVTKIANGHH
jgi:hypothetical protein